VTESEQLKENTQKAHRGSLEWEQYTGQGHNLFSQSWKHPHCTG